MSVQIGNDQLGTVIRKADYGVFIELENGETGLLHVSQMRGNSHWIRDKRLSEIAIGDETIVALLGSERDKKRNGLKRLRLSERVVQERLILERMALHEFITGTVSAKMEYGVFVFLNNWHVSGLLHVSRMEGASRNQRDDYLGKLKEGDKIQVMVTGIEQKSDRMNFQLSQYESPANLGKSSNKKGSVDMDSPIDDAA